MSTATRIIKNTGYLYAKMGITMFISLYTTRLILNSLGASDFGIFNIVGGAIAMLGFLNGAMASATQRFMSYSEGEGNKEKQKSIFTVSLVLHFSIAFIVGITLLIAGYFFFNGILNIPADRIFAAKVVYGSLIVSTMFTVMTVPYDAAMNAHENMKYYAIVGIFESLLKLAVALACVYTSYDKLIVYGSLMACIPLITLTIMRVYCHKHYKECTIQIKRYWNKRVMKEMTSFAGWNFTSSMTSVVTMQGLSIVLNSFWGVLANAAQGVANQLSGMIMTFSNSMLKALNPIIVKREGSHQREDMLRISLTGNKLSFFILGIFSIPFIVETPYILRLWLKNPPEFAVLFCRLIFLRQMLSQLSVTFSTSISAIGNIKNITIYGSIIWALALPVSIVAYYLGAPIYSIYVILIVMVIARDSNLICYMHKISNLSIRRFLSSIVLPCLIAASLTFIICYAITIIVEESIKRLVFVAFVSFIAFSLFMYKLSLTENEKKSLRNIVKNISKLKVNMNIKKIFPKFVHTIYMIYQTYGYDLVRNLKYGFAYKHNNDNLKANLLLVIHTIEKGLTMPNAHTNFGKDKIDILIHIVQDIIKNKEEDKNCFEVKYALSTLNDYLSFHEKRKVQIIPSILECIIRLGKDLSFSFDTYAFKQYHFTNEEFFQFTKSNFKLFSQSRHSIRNYKEQEINDEIFHEVMKIANNAPSSCNRQTCQSYIVKNKKIMQKILSIQGGNRGFGDLATAVIIVTSKLTSYYDVQDRLQPSINAGFYGMNLLYALHFHCIGACVLNWAYTKKKDLQLRALMPQIKDEEQICFLISCGYPADDFNVALSKKENCNQKYTIIK